MSHRPRHAATEPQIVAAILDAYRRGYFPMADGPPAWNPLARAQIHWFSPDPRGVLPLREAEGFHVSRSLEKTIRQRPFELRVDTAFERVMRGCATPRKPTETSPDNDQTWIDETLINWFSMLHRAGHVHSLEAWRTDPDTGEEALVGGIYGLSLGAAFFGESMFCVPRPRRADGSRHPLDGTDASKVCLVTLVRALDRAGYALFDTQMVTEHVGRLGGKNIPRARYLRRLEEALSVPDCWPNVVIDHAGPGPGTIAPD